MRMQSNKLHRTWKYTMVKNRSFTFYDIDFMVQLLSLEHHPSLIQRKLIIMQVLMYKISDTILSRYTLILLFKFFCKIANVLATKWKILQTNCNLICNFKANFQFWTKSIWWNIHVVMCMSQCQFQYISFHFTCYQNIQPLENKILPIIIKHHEKHACNLPRTN